ncbi:MAG: hypothetical protein JXP73_00050 [Deltaproteobacteria bacterium]|nr:hypothetical protein [Deltaproteobacteria bacterium]
MRRSNLELGAASLLSLLLGCSDDTRTRIPVGAEGGPCTAGGGCDPGLVCLSHLCVRLPDSAIPPGEGGAGGGDTGGSAGSGGAAADGAGTGGAGTGGAGTGGSAGTVTSGGAGATIDAAATGGTRATGGAGGTVDAAIRPDVPSSTCVSESDCTALGLHCDRNTRLCIECRDRDDCAATEQCSAGSCVSCTAGTRVCSAGGWDILACSPEEGIWTLVDSCTGGLECNEYTKTCTPPVVCAPNQPACNGTIATTCNADGTGYVAGGTPCSDPSGLCYQGACASCWPTTYFCSGATVRHCSADGTTSTLSATCTSSQYCDPATGMCKTRVCTPGQPACNGEIATTCNTDGSGYVAGGTSCTDTAEFCYRGACVSLACPPGRDFCSGSTVRHCADDGMDSTVSATCTSAEYCDSATVTCKPRVCAPNKPVCILGEWATTCNADGSGYAAGGHYCNPDMEGLCSDGVCRNIVGCTTSGQTFCLGSKVVECWSNLVAHNGETCTSLQYCDAATARCMPLLCAPNQPACMGNNAIVCSADGRSYLSETSCGAQHCVNGTCRDALFAEDFEDGDLVGWWGDLVGWKIGPDKRPYATRALGPTYAAAGSRYGLMMESTAALSGHLDRISQSFVDLRPRRMSWWMMTPSNAAPSGFFALSSGENDFAVSYFKEDGRLVLGYSMYGYAAEFVAIPCVTKVWYHIELRNVDWTAKTFDYYVNDTLIRAAAPFGAESPDGIASLSLLLPPGTTGYWDEIRFE